MRDDFADIINPIGRMEREAEQRGYRRGILTAIWWLLCAVVAGLVLVSLKAHAEPVRYKMTVLPIRASAVEARFTICQQYREFYGRWQCHAIR